jgi:hypothetical protein
MSLKLMVITGVNFDVRDYRRINYSVFVKVQEKLQLDREVFNHQHQSNAFCCKLFITVRFKGILV